MTRLFEQAIATVSTLPEDVQDDLARALLQLAGVDFPPIELTPEEVAEFTAFDTPSESQRREDTCCLKLFGRG